LTCPDDCPGGCGDGLCSDEEDCVNCSADCACPAGAVCDGSQVKAECVYGDAVCPEGPGETFEWCGNGYCCASLEDCKTCPQDCGECEGEAGVDIPPTKVPGLAPAPRGCECALGSAGTAPPWIAALLAALLARHRRRT